MLHEGVILAGGKGQRLMPLTAKFPKPLLTVGGKTPFERCINALEEAGITNVAVTTGYLSEKIEDFIFPNVNVTYYKEDTPLGTAGALRPFSHLLSEDFFVLSGDCVFDFSLSEMMEFHKQKKATVTIATVTSQDPTHYGTVLSENGYVVAFLEKPSWKQVVTTGINSGIYIINRSVFEKYFLECESMKDFSSDFFPALLERKEPVASFEAKGFWCDMGTPESFLSCNMHLSRGENVMGDYVSIHKDTKIEKSVIMNGVKVGSGTVIRNSVLAEGVHVGRDCVIENAVVGADSLICDKAVLENGCVVEADSIVGKGKAVKRSSKCRISFSDSGKIRLNNCENDLVLLGEGLAHVAKGKSLLFFCEKDKAPLKIVRESAQKAGAVVSNIYPTVLPVASFNASQKSTYSVFSEEEKGGVLISVFDHFGLPLSREDQIKIEKYSKVTSEKNPSGECLADFNPLEDYEKHKIEKTCDLSGIFVSLSASPEITKAFQDVFARKGGTVSDENYEYRFFIDDSGDDVYCLTKDGRKIGKTRLLSIIAASEPPKNLPIPDFLPDEITEVLLKYGGSFSVYGDTLSGRTSNSEPYSYSDGISIAIRVLHVSAKTNLSLSALDKMLPPFFFFEKTVYFDGNKGVAAEALHKKHYSEKEPFQIRQKTEKGTISFVPQYEKAFKIFACALSEETAEELMASAEKDISDLRHE